jgi:SAM-dependent methyltransferase
MRVAAWLRAVLEERLALMAPARRLRLALAEEEVLRRLGSGPLRVLDAGCGDGLLSLAMAERHRDWALLGVDRRDDLLDGARARAGAGSLGNVAFAAADLEKPLPAAGFDAVLAIECLSEIPDDRLALQMMREALAPGGLLVVQVPDREWQPILPGSAATWREQVRQGYGADELASAVRDAGFVEVEVRPTFRTLAAAAQEIRDRIKGSPLAVRLLAFSLLAGAVRLERLHLTWGRSNALIASGRLPRDPSPSR